MGGTQSHLIENARGDADRLGAEEDKQAIHQMISNNMYISNNEKAGSRQVYTNVVNYIDMCVKTERWRLVRDVMLRR